MSNRQITTRFAPSPTGYLHAGGARTALFNWAFARRHGGRFVLRLEDTDRKRSTDQAASQIFEDLRWLGLEWDEGPQPDPVDPSSSYLDTQVGDHGPYCQSQRLETYDGFIQKLLDSGRAYESLESMNADESGQKGTVVRFKTSGEAISIEDKILGRVTVQPEELEDFIIRKSDGYATYHLAVVVDDHLMNVSHVFRAQEHLSNTPKHWALQEALGFKHPTYAHFPLIFNPDGKKMSKREKPRAARAAGKMWIEANGTADQLASLCDVSREQLVEFLDAKTDNIATAEVVASRLDVRLPEIDVHDFRRSGYLPEVLCNYLCLLGWSPGNDLEVFDKQYLSDHFDVSRVGKSSAKFDRKKLLKFNADAIRTLPPDQFRLTLREYGNQFYSEKVARLPDERFGLFCHIYQNRSRTLAEPFISGAFVFVSDDQIEFSIELLKTCIPNDIGQGLNFLRAAHSRLRELDDFQSSRIDALLNEICVSLEITMSAASQLLRVALTGSKVSPSIGSTCELLGQTSVLARVERCLEKCTT